MQLVAGVGVGKEVIHMGSGVVDDVKQSVGRQIVLSGNMFEQVADQILLNLREDRHFHQHHHDADQLAFADGAAPQADRQLLLSLFGHDIVLIGRADHFLNVITITEQGHNGDLFGSAERG